MSEREHLRGDGGAGDDTVHTGIEGGDTPDRPAYGEGPGGSSAFRATADDDLARQETVQLSSGAERQETVPGLTPTGSDRTVALPPGYAAPGHAPHSVPADPDQPAYDRPTYDQPTYDQPIATDPDYSPRPVAVRRPDSLGGLLLLLAGVAAAISLLLPWLTGDDRTGLDLVRRGFDDLGVGLGEPFDTGFWQPLAVVLGGGVLLVLGLLLLVPARRHRFIGLLALLVSGIATAAVLVPAWRADWDLADFDLGFWFGVAVAALGLLGGLKALLTGRRYRRET